MRFKTAEMAQEFHKEFLRGQEEMKKLLEGSDSKEGAAEADEAAKALETLKVEETKPAEGEAKTDKADA